VPIYDIAKLCTLYTMLQLSVSSGAKAGPGRLESKHLTSRSARTPPNPTTTTCHGSLSGRFIQPDQDDASPTSTSGSFEWTDGYSATDVATFHEDHEAVTIPVMPLSKVKVVTDTVQLNIFEPRYRTMFRLVKRSRSRVFGVALREANGLSSVGVLCELTHYVPVPSRKSIFVSARAIGRFNVKDIVHSKPFVAVRADTLYDDDEPSMPDETATTEEATWATMVNVRELVGSLTGSLESDNDEAFSLEVRRWSPKAEVRGTVAGSISSHPRMLEECQRAGLMGDANPTPVTSVSRESLHSEDTAIAYVSSEAKMSAEEREARRAEKLSFALARSLDLDDDGLLGMMLVKSTSERLRQCASVIEESERYLRARSAIKQLDLD